MTAASAPAAESSRVGILPLIDVNVARIGLRAHRKLVTPQTAPVYAQILQKSAYTCQMCGIMVPGFMEIHHKNGNHHDQSVENLACICHFCHKIQHPVASGQRAQIEPIWAPEASQNEIIRMAWAQMAVSYLAANERAGQIGLEEAMDEIDDHIANRRNLAATILATGRTDVLMMTLYRLQASGSVMKLDMSGFRFWPVLQIEAVDINNHDKIVDLKSEAMEAIFGHGGSFHDTNWLKLADVVKHFQPEVTANWANLQEAPAGNA